MTTMTMLVVLMIVLFSQNMVLCVESAAFVSLPGESNSWKYIDNKSTASTDTVHVDKDHGRISILNDALIIRRKLHLSLPKFVE